MLIQDLARDTWHIQGTAMCMLSQVLMGSSGCKGHSNACDADAGAFSTEHQARPEVGRERSWHVLYGTSCQREVSSSGELVQAGPDKASSLCLSSLHQP